MKILLETRRCAACPSEEAGPPAVGLYARNAFRTPLNVLFIVLHADDIQLLAPSITAL